jgi:hypothetical protein
MPARVATLLGVATVALLTSCGGGGERDAVERYIERANAIQESFAAQFRHANEAYAQFAKGKLDAKTADIQLTLAEAALRDERAQLARVEPPSSAIQLHRRLLRVVAMNAEFAEESTALARYLPAARKLLARVGRDGKRLSTELGAADTPARQSRALARYARAIDDRYDALYALDPPPVLESTHRDQLLRLSASSGLARRLRAAAQARDSRRVARLVLEFRKVSRSAGRGRLTRGAIREYNDRYGAVREAVAAMHREQRRLEQRLD